MSANTGDIVWKIPFGVYPELIAKGIPPTGTPNLGGPIATASGLVFIGATKDARFRAYDAKTGKELWYAQLEAAGAATPMTFMGKDGKQYVVIASGGPGDTDRGGTENYPQKLVAFALSDRTSTTPAAPATATSSPAASTGGGACGHGINRVAGRGTQGGRARLHRVSRPWPGHHRRPHAGRVEEGRRRDGVDGRAGHARRSTNRRGVSESGVSGEEVRRDLARKANFIDCR